MALSRFKGLDMIKLSPMTASEYPAYCDYFIDDYSREIAENYGHSIDRAIELGKVRTSIPRTKNENFSHLISMGYQ